MPTPTGRYVQAEGRPPVQIMKIKHGEKITEPGIYDIPMLWYHDDCCDGPSISSSGLRTIWRFSPNHYWDKSPLNRDRDDVDEETEEQAQETAALRIGRAAHTLLLEPQLFKEQFVVRIPIYTSWQTKASKLWRAEQQRAGFTVLDPPEMQRVNGVATALRKHALYRDGLLDGDIELSFVWKDEKTGVWLKARPDAVPIGSNMFADLKVVIDARTVPLSRKVFDFGYDVQMALGGVGMFELLGRVVDEFVLVAVESKRPHGIRIAPIDKGEIRTGLSILRWSINKFAECYAANDWPSFEDEDNEYIHRSEPEKARLAKLIEQGKLPKEF